MLSLRYYDRLSALAPHSVVLGGFILFFIVLLLPVLFALGCRWCSRARYGTPRGEPCHPLTRRPSGPSM